MTRFLAIAIFVLSSVPAFSMPQFLELYRKDPFRNPNVDGCNTCHMSAQGGDARNAFGQAFESGGEQITTMLRAQFPDRFVYPISRVSSDLSMHFSDPDKKQMVVETGGSKNLVDLDRTAVNGTPATNTTAPTGINTVAAAQRPASEIPVDRDAREGAFFGSITQVRERVCNIPANYFVSHCFKLWGFLRRIGIHFSSAPALHSAASYPLRTGCRPASGHPPALEHRAAG